MFVVQTISEIASFLKITKFIIFSDLFLMLIYGYLELFEFYMHKI